MQRHRAVGYGATRNEEVFAIKRVLHITSHMGGGVGKVLAELALHAIQSNTRYQHQIILLEPPEKVNFIDLAKRAGIEISIVDDYAQLIEAMGKVDIVSLEWWHHPKMAGLLANFPQVESRIVVWSHISGCYYPYIPPELLKIPEKFIFTSQYSFENPYWNLTQRHFAANTCAMVNSSGGFQHIAARRQAHRRFRIGYVGTQSFAKLHPEFVRYCKAVAHLPEVEFVMVGDQTNQETILQEAKLYGIENRFTFINYVSDVSEALSTFDVFGYILNPTHFGTTENALLEAMAAGLPVICLNQCAERYLIRNGETGILIADERSYKEAVQFLFENPEERSRLGTNAHAFMLQRFSIERTVSNLQSVYDEVMKKPKHIHEFKSVFGEKPYQWFLACLPPMLKGYFNAHMSNDEGRKNGTVKVPMILKGKNKGSIGQFYRYYEQDQVLKYWSSLV